GRRRRDVGDDPHEISRRQLIRASAWGRSTVKRNDHGDVGTLTRRCDLILVGAATQCGSEHPAATGVEGEVDGEGGERATGGRSGPHLDGGHLERDDGLDPGYSTSQTWRERAERA